MYAKLVEGTRNSLPLLSVNLIRREPSSRPAATRASTSAAVCDDSKLISRGLLVIPMRMSTRERVRQSALAGSPVHSALNSAHAERQCNLALSAPTTTVGAW